MNRRVGVFASLTAALVLSACVAVPVPVDADIERRTHVQFDDGLLLTAGPRRAIEAVANSITKQDSDISVVDAITFRDAAFPDGGWRLADFLPSRSAAVAATSGVRYLLIMDSAPITVSGPEEGFPVLPVGTLYQRNTSTLQAVLIDLQSGEQRGYVRARAEGADAAVYYIVYAVGTVALTDSAVLNSSSEIIVSMIRSDVPSGPVRLAILSAEGSPDPFGLQGLNDLNAVAADE